MTPVVFFENLFNVLFKSNKTRVLVFNFSGTKNFGDEAIMEVLVREINKIYKDVEIIMVRRNKRYIKPEFKKVKIKIIKTNSYTLGRFLFFLALIKADLLIIGGGGLFQDFGSKILKQNMLDPIIRRINWAKFLRKKIYVVGVGVGEVKLESSRKELSKSLNKVDLITVRDYESFIELKKLGVADFKITNCADLVFLRFPTVNKSVPVREGNKLVVGISILPFFSANKVTDKIKRQNHVKTEIAKTCNYLLDQKKAKIYLIPMDFGQDEPFLNGIKEKVNNKKDIKLVNTEDTTGLFNIYKSLDLLIGARYHSLVYAILANKPFVAVTYHQKTDSLIKEFDFLPKVNYFNFKADLLIRHLNYCLDNRNFLIKKIEQRRNDLIQRSTKNFSTLVDSTL